MSVLMSQLSILLDIAIFLLTTAITWMAFHLYMLFRKPRYLQFSTGFLCISIGYFFVAIINVFTYPNIHTTGIEQLALANVLRSLWFIPILVGLTILTILYYNINERRLQLLFVTLLIAGFTLGGFTEVAFFTASSILFFFIALKLYHHHRTEPDQSSLLILTGFSLLFISKLFSGILFIHEGLYIGYYIFKLAGVGLITHSTWVISR
ncbi:TPA: hypothetical protein HA251_01795 [Candidatus Woesearchaeota archaeon]|nr:hypothetical protein [Candidatus Woesearchaeota archaeon]